MKITITLDPDEVEFALLDKIKKDEEMAQIKVWIISATPKPKPDGNGCPSIDVEVGIGIPF